MQIEQYDSPGPYILYDYKSGVLQNTTTGFAGHDRYKTGECSGIVKGDFVHPLGWSYDITTSSDIKGTYVLRDGIYRTVREGAIPNCNIAKSLLSKVSASDPYNKALAKLYDKIRSDVDLSIDIYQGGQTVSFLMDLGKALANPTRTLARGLSGLVKSGKIKRGSQLIADKWLEWQYGIKPTMSTIYALTGEMIETISNDQGFLVTKARASSREPYPSMIKRGSWSSTFNVALQGEISRWSEINLCYTIADAERNALSQFTSLNPVSFIYENVPFSFVLDWIVDVGGYIRMMETACLTGLQFETGYRTSSLRNYVVANLDDTYKDSYKRTHTAKGTGWAKRVNSVRTPLGAMPRPRLPSLKISLGSQRLASAAALLRGFLK